MDILNTDLNNVSLHSNFYEEDLDIIILIRLLAWHIKFEKLKALIKDVSEELIHCNGTRPLNHLVRKRILNHLAKLAK